MKRCLTLLVLGASLVAFTQRSVAERVAAAPAEEARKPTTAEIEAWEKREAEERAIKAVVKQIDDELGTLNRDVLPAENWAKEWAGEYYEGDGLGVNVRIVVAPAHGIAVTNHGCLGFYGGATGEIIEVLNDGLRIKITQTAVDDRLLTERLYFVKHGSRRYLVPSTSMMALVNNWNEGGSSREAMYGIPRLVREVNGVRVSTLATGRPELPPEYAKLVRDDPIKMKVLSVGEPKYLKCTAEPTVVGRQAEVTLDCGSTGGIYVGMKFGYRLADYTKHTYVEILSVEPNRCVARFYDFQYPDDTLFLPKVDELVKSGE